MSDETTAPLCKDCGWRTCICAYKPAPSPPAEACARCGNTDPRVVAHGACVGGRGCDAGTSPPASDRCPHCGLLPGMHLALGCPDPTPADPPVLARDEVEVVARAAFSSFDTTGPETQRGMLKTAEKIIRALDEVRGRASFALGRGSSKLSGALAAAWNAGRASRDEEVAGLSGSVLRLITERDAARDEVILLRGQVAALRGDVDAARAELATCQAALEHEREVAKAIQGSAEYHAAECERLRGALEEVVAMGCEEDDEDESPERLLADLATMQDIAARALAKEGT